AFDEEIVSAAIQERYSATSTHSGRAFLEKIIQIPLRLPASEQQVLRNYCLTAVGQALRDVGVVLTDDQGQKYVRGVNAGFEEQIDTPRKAKLYANILTFSLPILAGEVNPVDLMLIEGIRVFFPKLYASILEHPDAFLGSNTQRLERSEGAI